MQKLRELADRLEHLRFSEEASIDDLHAAEPTLRYVVNSLLGVVETRVRIDDAGNTHHEVEHIDFDALANSTLLNEED